MNRFCMAQVSHQVHINASSGSSGDQLAQGFSEFITASARLELSYRELQARVATLTLRLDEQGRALQDSLSEKDHTTALLRQLVEAMPCGVLLLNEDETVRLANPEAARLLALSSAQMPTGPLGDRSTASASASHLASLLSGTEDGTEQEFCFESSAGRHWISSRRVQLPSFSPSSMQTGCAALILQDISPRKLEEQRRESARDTVALAQISALLAHEIRNPLASLELFAGLLADSPDRKEEWLSHLRAGIRSLSGTVNNVLTLHGEALPAVERVELSSEVTSAIQFLQPLAQQAQVQLLQEPKEGELWVRANRSAIHQLMLNLVTNALRHTSSGGSVRVHVQRSDRHTVLLSVRDTGAGIAAEHLPRLFEGGFSASGTRPGLGLAVCTRLMQHQGGSINVQSQPGQGSTFILEFQTA